MGGDIRIFTILLLSALALVAGVLMASTERLLFSVCVRSWGQVGTTALCQPPRNKYPYRALCNPQMTDRVGPLGDHTALDHKQGWIRRRSGRQQITIRGALGHSVLQGTRHSHDELTIELPPRHPDHSPCRCLLRAARHRSQTVGDRAGSAKAHRSETTGWIGRLCKPPDQRPLGCFST